MDYKKKIVGQNIDIYGSKDTELPNLLKRWGATHIHFFSKDKANLPVANSFQINQYSNIASIVNSTGDICLLDGEAIRVLLAKFPRNTQYVFVRLAPCSSWILGVIGLTRRYLRGWLAIEGVIHITENERSYGHWLVIRNLTRKNFRRTMHLPESVGIPFLLNWLREEKIEYVILRFFEKLPELYREGGDLDILVTDDDEEKIINFLRYHSKELKSSESGIRMDIWTVHGAKHYDLPYYPPPIAKRIINSAVDGPAGSRIPAPEEAFLSFIYHCLYHKGYASGIPSRDFGENVTKSPENDYAGVIGRMARDLGIEISINMEDLDDYLAEQGWQPKLDTLAHIAVKNRWVQDKLFSKEETKDDGICVFILKKKVLKEGFVEPILEAIEKEGFKVIRKKVFNRSEERLISEHLRGGNWQTVSGRVVDDFMPAMAIVTVDLHFPYLTLQGKTSTEAKRKVKRSKERVRKKFDDEKTSVIHSTDDTSQAEEYITICFPKEALEIREEAEVIRNTHTLSLQERVTLRFRMFPHYIGESILKMKELVARLFVR